MGRATNKAEMRALQAELPPYVVVRVSPLILTEQLGLKKTLPDGSVYWMDSVYFYWSDDHGIEAEPVFHKEFPRGQSS